MNAERLNGLDPRMQGTITQLKEMIRGRFPTATFEVSRGEEAESIHLTTIVDGEDPDDVVDMVINRVLELQVEEGIPIHVIPLRTPERVLHLAQAARWLRLDTASEIVPRAL